MFYLRLTSRVPRRFVLIYEFGWVSLTALYKMVGYPALTKLFPSDKNC